MAHTRLPDRVSVTALVARTAAALLVLALVRFFYKLYQVRMLVRDAAQKYGIPIMPHSFWLGHLGVMGEVASKYPPDLNPQVLPLLLAHEYPEIGSQSILYVDLWPVSDPMLAVFHPDMIAQFAQDFPRPKHHEMHAQFRPFSGCNDLVNQNGQVWKTWRSIFNPGFSAKNLLSLIPAFLEEIQVFRDWLDTVAESGQVVPLEPKAMRATADIIGRATLGERLHCQESANPLFEALKTALSWLIGDASPPSILKSMHPLRRFELWKSNRTMWNYLKPRIERGVAEHLQDKSGSAGPKTILSLAIQSYVNEVQVTSAGRVPGVDPKFVEMAISQIKIFMLAGHDTTASTLCFIYHFLNKNQNALAAVRAEHDEVLGKDPRTVRDTLAANPQLLNHLPYTSAVIKETLRLFPPAGTIREGADDFFLTHPDTGMRYPTKGMMIFGCSMAEHRTEQFWPRPHEFVPERWLAKEGEPLHVRKNAFRSFELGPRNCIGQELAQMELKAILAMTIRDFDISSVSPQGAPEWRGDPVYQTRPPGEITGHPKDYMPVRVVKRH